MSLVWEKKCPVRYLTHIQYTHALSFAQSRDPMQRSVQETVRLAVMSRISTHDTQSSQI